MKHQFEFRRGLGFAAGLVALVAISVVGVSSLAAAADSGSGSSGSSSTIHPQRQPLSDAQKQCLADQGVTLPAKPADGSRPQITDEQRAALRKAAQACGLPTFGHRGKRPQLTDAQKQCLADQGVTLPAKPADGSRPQITDEQRAALRKAAQACGLPTGPGPRDGGGSAGGSSTSA